MPCFPCGLWRYEMHDEPRSLDPHAAGRRDPHARAATPIGEGSSLATATVDGRSSTPQLLVADALLTLDSGALAVPACYSTDASSPTHGPCR